jgi:hypothetical protein
MPSENISIKVTQADIDKAITKISSRCVVATAIARDVPGATGVQVDVQSVRFTKGGVRHTYFTPPAVAGYVVAFDAGDDIHPFRFTLREDQRLPVRRRMRTPAGNEKARVSAQVRTAKASVKRAEAKVEKLKEEQAPPAAIARAENAVAGKIDAIAEAEAARQEVMAVYSGYKVQEIDDPSLPPPRPQVFKKNSRHYGHRKLRINQPPKEQTQPATKA